MMSDVKLSHNNNIKDENEEEKEDQNDISMSSSWDYLDEGTLYEHCGELLHQSRTHLMLREFLECINICNEGLSVCRAHSSQNRSNCCFEGFVILAVQAYGEQNLWREVLPFIDKAYGEVRLCPPTIMKLCIGLLSWVGEYSLAQRQASLWLDEVSNKVDLEQHTDVGRVVLEKVLIPQKKYKEIHSMLVKLDGMVEEEKDSILKWIDQMNVAMDQRQNTEKNSQSEVEVQFKKGVSQSLLLTVLLRMRNFLSWLPSLMNNGVGKVVFFGLSFYIIFLHLKISDAILGPGDISRTVAEVYSQHFKR